MHPSPPLSEMESSLPPLSRSVLSKMAAGFRRLALSTPKSTVNLGRRNTSGQRRKRRGRGKRGKEGRERAGANGRDGGRPLGGGGERAVKGKAGLPIGSERPERCQRGEKRMQSLWARSDTPVIWLEEGGLEEEDEKRPRERRGRCGFGGEE